MSGIRGRILGLTAEFPPVFWLLWIGTVVNRVGGFVMPFLSLYLTSERGFGVGQAGLVAALFGAGAVAAHLVGGELADRIGRRPVLLLSLLGTPPFMLALGLAHDLWWIAALTTVVGFLTDLLRPAVNAAVTDVVAPASRTRAFGYLYWAINLGAALALILAGFMTRISYVLLFVGDAVTTLAYGLIVLWRVRETQPTEAVHAARLPTSIRLQQLAQEPILLALTFITLATSMIFAQGLVTLPLDMQAHGLGPSDYGLAGAVNPILIVFITLQLSAWIARLPHFRAMALAALFLGAGFGMNAWATSLPTYMLAIGVWTFGEIIGAAVAPAIIAELSPIELRGLYQGFYGSAWGLAFFAGPVLGSWAFDRFSADVLWLSCAVIGVLAAGAYFGLSGAARRRLSPGKSKGVPP